MSWFCLKASWISCTVASLIDEKPRPSTSIAWALDDAEARSRDENIYIEKLIIISGEKN